MSDYLVRGMSMDGFVKVAAIRSTELVQRGASIHKTTPNATAAFGRALTAASMMGNMQKVENGSMTLQIRGGGPIGTITVVSDAVGNVRGCVTEANVPLAEKYPGKLDVGATVGTDGTLTVIRDLQMKEPYIGSVQLVSGEIGDDVTAYFVQSEQVPTACALGVLVDRDHSVKVAGGYLIQLLPGAPDEIIDKLDLGSVMYPKYITAEYIVRFVRAMKNSLGSNIETMHYILDGKAEALEFRIKENSPISGVAIEKLNLKKNILIACINRGGHIIIPRGRDVIQTGDTVIVVAGRMGFKDVSDILK